MELEMTLSFNAWSALFCLGQAIVMLAAAFGVIFLHIVLLLYRAPLTVGCLVLVFQLLVEVLTN